MTFTVTLWELAVVVAAAAVTASAIVLAREMRRVGAAADELRRSARVLGPRLERTAEELERSLASVQELADRLQAVAGDAREISARAARAAGPLIEDVERLRRSGVYLKAAARGVVAGIRSLQHHNARVPDDDGESAERREAR